MTHESRFEKALSSSEPLDALRAFVFELSTEGLDKSTILQVFEKQRQLLRMANRETDEDIVMDVMDFLVGWCSPRVQLLADEAENLSQSRQIKSAPIQEVIL